MSTHLDPVLLFDLLKKDIPADLHENVLIVGSLAAAFDFRAQLHQSVINTKDADVAIQPAGAIAECRAIAQRLIDTGWQRVGLKCFPCADSSDPEKLRVVRLHPPNTEAYFLELIAFPEQGQTEPKKMLPVQLDDGWYCLPSFRFMRLTGFEQRRAHNGLAYAAPAMMALSNLLSHPIIGTATMSDAIAGRKLLRSSKDLGRVLALARLSTRQETEAWPDVWHRALLQTFPAEVGALAKQAQFGIVALLDDARALEDARVAVDDGILRGHDVTVHQLKAIGRQLLMDALEPLAQLGAGRPR